MSKVILLDFDGVLNSHAWFKRRPTIDNGERVMRAHSLDPAAVGLLNQLIDRTDAKVVISSTWRMFGLHQCKAFLSMRGFCGKVIGATPELGGPRGKEIQWWFDQLEDWQRPESFVILDDDSDMEHLLPRLIKTTFDVGITQEHVDAAVEMLAVPFEWPEETQEFETDESELLVPGTYGEVVLASGSLPASSLADELRALVPNAKGRV